MSLRYALLGVLSLGEMSGYDIKRRFDKSLHFVWNASDSQIYRELRSMEEIGLVESAWIPQESKPNKRLYQLTKEGETGLDSWLQSTDGWESIHDKDAFMLRMFFMGRLPRGKGLEVLRQRYEQLERSIRFYETRLREYGDTKRSRRPRLLRWQLRLLEGMHEIDSAQRAWIDGLINDLERDDRKSSPRRRPTAKTEG